jgi:dTMP kinase
MRNNRGLFLTFEGIEGAGKSSNLEHAKAIVEASGKTVTVSREPGGTEIGEKIREVLLDPNLPAMHSDTELLLMFASRAEHYQNKILPALTAGNWVLCDRFTDASFAYQGGGRNIDINRIAALEEWALGNFRADKTFLFDLPVNVGLSRAKARSAADRIEQEESDFFERIRESYLMRAQDEPNRFSVIDASQTMEGVRQQVEQAVEGLIQKVSV